VSIAPPLIAVTLAINPPNFKLGTDVELSVTAVSNATFPVTIFTWPSVFNLELAQKRGNFVGVDRDTGMKLPMHDIQAQRTGFNHTLEGRDDKYHVTLEPGQPLRFNSPFSLAHGSRFREEDQSSDSDLPEGHANLLPGHRYLLDIRKDYYDTYLWWKVGRKEDVLDLPGQDRGGDWESGEPIVLSLDEPVEFKVLPLDN
jgi:hypothetical protein